MVLSSSYNDNKLIFFERGQRFDSLDGTFLLDFIINDNNMIIERLI